MTPTEQDREAARWAYQAFSRKGGTIEDIAIAIATARAEERERLAGIAEGIDRDEKAIDFRYTGSRIVAAIRALDEK